MCSTLPYAFGVAIFSRKGLLVSGRRLARYVTDALFHPPPAEPHVQVSKHTALRWPDSREVGWMCRDHRRIRPAAEPHPRHLASLAPYRSGPPAPLRQVAGSPGLELLRGLRHPRARAPEAISCFTDPVRPSAGEAVHSSLHPRSFLGIPPGGLTSLVCSKGRTRWPHVESAWCGVLS